jgi:L-fuconolactonase
LIHEEILYPEQIICDAHHHLWDYPESMYLIDEFLNDVGEGHKFVSTVYVECQRRYRTEGPEHLKPVGETEFIEALVSSYKQNVDGPDIAAGIVGFADLTLGAAVDEVLNAHAQASSRFRGVRYMTAWHESDQLHNAQTNPDEALLAKDTFLEGFACLEKRNLSFDAWVYHTQIGEVGALARAFPEVTIILNHVGGPVGVGPYKDKREEVFERWQEDISELAKERNVMIKLGGLTMALGGFGWKNRDPKPDYRELAEHMGPYYRACISLFGAERCMFESNFPVDKVSGSYSNLWNAFKHIAQDYRQIERMQLFHDTAVRVYRL